MPATFKKYSRTRRGYRTQGHGKIGGNRKKGASGGTGLTTGIFKYKWSLYLKQKKLGFPNEKWIIGKHGFKLPPSVQRLKAINAINIKDLEAKIDKWVNAGKAQKKGDLYICDLADVNVQKLIGNGRVTKKMEITVNSASSKTVEKFKEAKCKLNLTKKSVE
jgi:large subunit ribosomal protein L15